MKPISSSYKLVCSTCGKSKYADKKRIEKYKDTEYVCRACRKKE